ncbi:hypothetical protein MACK_001382 [Theileria orientalis]|uniref:Uncharacterized protein n=1 Tax=Theileria orientalis TaxID=68886 RepID=A0A976QVL1_THEOR|nr:hypothetical protein MACK_001382 [Theileria orientalis]
MSDSHPRDSDTEGGVDSSSFEVQNDIQTPLNVKEEELNMNFDDTGAEEPSIEEQLELSMEDHKLDSDLKLEEEKPKTELISMDLKMDEDYTAPSLNDEPVKHEDTEHLFKHEDSEPRLKVESFHDIKSAEEAEEPSTLEQDDKDIVGLFEDSDENETSDSKSKLSPTLTSQDQLQQKLEQDKMKDMLDKPLETFEEKKVINTTLTLVPKPQDPERLAICRFPPTLKVVSHSDVRNFLRSNPQLLERPPNTNTLAMLCFRRTSSCTNKSNNQAPSPGPADMSTDGELNNRKNIDSIHTGAETVVANTPNSTPTQESVATPRTSDAVDRVDLQKRIIENLIATDNKRKRETSTWESNGKMVVWEDGNVSMFVGKVPLDCESVKEMSFLLEDERADLKPVHAQVHTRLQTRFSNLHTRFSTFKNDPIKKKEHKRQKMEVTSLSDAIQSHHALQQNLIHVRENERQKKLNYHSKGLTRSFLESSDSEDDM